MASAGMEPRLAGVVAQLTEKVEQAGFGQCDWNDIAASIGAFAPGSWVLMFGVGAASVGLLRPFSHNMDPRLPLDFLTHFAPLNPWNPLWKSEGEVKVTRKTHPSRLFTKTEFVQDFMRKAGNCDDGVGLAVNVDPSTQLAMAVHLDNGHIDRQEDSVIRLLRAISDPFKRAVRANQILAEADMHSKASAALVHRMPDMALVVDNVHRIIDCNEAASKALSRGDILTGHNNRLDVRSVEAGFWMRRGIEGLHLRQSVVDVDRIMTIAGKPMRLRLVRLPSPDAGRFLDSRSHVLVLVRDLSPAAHAFSLEQFGRLYGLLPSELRVCQSLVAGLSVAEIADELGNSPHTIRSHLKSIFQKTGTGRQSELVSLIARLG